MTYVESPTQTLTRFVSSWKNTPPERLSEEIISTFNETHRKPDEYKFKFKEGRFVDYTTEAEIKVDTSTYLGKKDSELLESLNRWAAENTTGAAIWISPSFDSSYPSNKITVYSLKEENGEKTTTNISVLFDTPKEHTLEIATRLNPLFASTDDPESLRNKLFIMNGGISLVSLLRLIGGKQFFPETPGQEIINHFVDEIYSGRDPGEIAMEMQNRGIIGKYPVSCGGSVSGVSLDSAALSFDFSGSEDGDRYGSLTFTCPRCGASNTRPYGQLISHCQHCGGDVRC